MALHFADRSIDNFCIVSGALMMRDFIQPMPRMRQSRLLKLVTGPFRLSPDEALFETRGFSDTDPLKKARLEHIGRIFIHGYNLAFDNCNLLDPSERMDLAPQELGFALEGYAMGVALAELTPLRFLGALPLSSFLSGAAPRHSYLTTVGVGWALARVPWRRRATLRRLDAGLALLAFDGWGFSDYYFHKRQYLPTVPPAIIRLAGLLGGRSWTRGVGRALWFRKGGDVPAIARAIECALPEQREDLFAGLGLATLYARGLTSAEYGDLLALAGPYRASFLQGGAFALEAHASGQTDPENRGAHLFREAGFDPDRALENVRATRPYMSWNEGMDRAWQAHADWWNETAGLFAQTKGNRA